MFKSLKSSFALRIVLMVFMCLLFSSLFTITVTVFLIWLGVRIPTVNFIIYISFAFLVSSIIGTLIAIALSKSFSVSHNKFKRALREVASGNFDVVINENENIIYSELAHDLNTMIRELKSVQVLRNDFISNFSHEFKTPISSINGFAELLLDEKIEDSERIEYAKIIFDESSRLLNLAKNTLMLSKLDGKMIVSEKSYFSLNDLIERNLLLFEKQLAEKNITINTDLQSVRYYWDSDLLSQVFINLFLNAIKYGKEGGKIEVALKRDGENVIITVTDDGIGMDEETLSRIFERYYQGDKSHKTEGNGLGLAIVERIVSLCEGKIVAQSKKGEGSTFTVTIPMRTA